MFSYEVPEGFVIRIPTSYAICSASTNKFFSLARFAIGPFRKLSVGSSPPITGCIQFLSINAHNQRRVNVNIKLSTILRLNLAGNSTEGLAFHLRHQKSVKKKGVYLDEGVHDCQMTSKRNVSRRACDNVECGRIQEKKEFRRCGGCRQLLYCSQNCQRLDWNSGHRESCAWHLRRRKEFLLDDRPRAAAFMRALVHHAYKLTRLETYKILVEEWAIQPDTAFFVLYDSRSGGTTGTVHRASHMPPDEADARYWADMVARESRSGGRMFLHVMRVREGAGERDWVIPLRSETSKIPDALKRIAAEGASLDPKEVEERINKLLEEDEVMEIH
ncbi:hypothetical protein DFH06DRAFT_1436089 [Mycena polygramma]|nr:hypothetical protein DFH06DRAFT_1436089 [Mycena polygramma]